LGEGIKAT